LPWIRVAKFNPSGVEAYDDDYNPALHAGLL
jgi:hypothetical protein